MNGFVEGNIVEDFLIMNDEMKNEIIKDMNYPWSRSEEATVAMIEMLRSSNYFILEYSLLYSLLYSFISFMYFCS